MARNIEIKARIESVDSIFPKAVALADEGPVEIFQDDTFFVCQNGRLKLRAFSPASGELIFYRRADQPGPKESFYLLSPTTAPDVLRESLTLAYGQAGRVRKKRTLFLVGRTRIHLDRVEGVGDFLELEVVLQDGEEAKAGEATAKDLMKKLDIRQDQLIEGAYVDLLRPEKSSGTLAGKTKTGEINSSLNTFRDEAAEFLDRVDPEGIESEVNILAMLEEEFSELKKSVRRWVGS